ncbi:MAG: hypothetical protein WBP46_07470 [Thiolinea sp.]
MQWLKQGQLKRSLIGASVLLAITCSPTKAATPDFKAQKLKTFTAQQVSSAVSDLGVAIPDNLFKYQVSLYRLTYQTVDGYGKAVTASGVVAVPNKGVYVSSPLLSFQHGTIFQDKEAPSNDLSAGAPPTILASLGYITIASDYVGYGASKGKAHPYLLKTPSARAVTDFIKRSATWLKQNNISLNKQLFLTGYSEGGYVTMAAHQALQAQAINGLNLTAIIPAAGPYHISRTLKSIVSLSSTSQDLEALAADNTSQRLSPVLVDWLTKRVMDALIPDDSDVVFQDKIIRDYLRNGSAGVVKHDVYDWKSKASVTLFHGRDGVTVPFFNASDADTAMTAKGSPSVTLVECTAKPADHEGCISEYGKVLIQTLENYAHNL